jgi:signal transduction histidine kinase
MRPLNALVPFVAGLLIALTYLLVQGTAPDAERHERTLDALRTVFLYNAALQRDVLRARAGLLRNYDPLVASMARLGEATARLAEAGEITSGDARADIDRSAAALAAAVRDEEALVEAFKSDNALLHNSLSYFNYTVGRMAAGGDSPSAPGIVALAAAMLRFVNDPRPELASDVSDAFDELTRRPDNHAPGAEAMSLVSHGRLIVQTLPRVDDVVAHLQAAATTDRARTLQDAYMAAHGRAADSAGRFQAFLYIAALILVGYIVYLFIRLRANAQILRERLDFEGLISSISTEFINLPHNRIRENVAKALKRLVDHAGLDGAEIIVHQAGKADLAASYAYRSPATRAPGRPLEEVLDFALDWSMEAYQRNRLIFVPDVGQMPESLEKATLRTHGIRTWLCIPMRLTGDRQGIFTLHAMQPRPWRQDDITLLRTAAELFANAIARERGEIEREALQARLNQSQRLEAIGTLAGGIAHEFNNILGAILGYGEMAQGALRNNPAARRYVRQMVKAGERARDVVDQVLAFGRRRDREHRPVLAGTAIAEAIELMRAALPATLSVRTDLKAGDATIMGDRTELQQVVMNLGQNAAQAMNGRGLLELGLDTVDAARRLTLSHGGLPAGRYIRLTVSDTGHGMDQATIERIFEPFFTTKPAGQGTGLGLSTVHGIVTALRGAVNVRSRPGEGTTFEIYIPRLERAAPPAAETVIDPAPRGRGETILIVDDDKSLVLLGEEMLAALGYEPVGFDDSKAALAAFRVDPGRFDLLLTDEVMPELTGLELADACHQVRPDLPVLLMTGDTRPLRPERIRAAGIREILRKPLLAAQLGECVARYLDGQAVPAGHTSAAFLDGRDHP